jgi:Flp pilus assembly protein TadD
LLKRFREICTQSDRACLTTNWNLLGKETSCLEGPLEAPILWLNSLLPSGIKAKESLGNKPRRFSWVARSLGEMPIYKTLEPFAPAAQHLAKEADTRLFKDSGWYVKFLATLVYYLFKGLYQLRKGRIQANPEQALLKALSKDLRQGPLIWLIDDHDLASTIQINTRLTYDEDIYWTNAPHALAFNDYLKLVLRYFSASPGNVISIVSGRRPLPLSGRNLPHWHYQPLTLLRTLTPEEIGRLVSPQLMENDEEPHAVPRIVRDEIAQRLMRLTQGNPLLVEYAVSLLHRLSDSPPSGRTGLELWEASIETPFRKDESIGFHWFVTERLAERVKGYKETHGKLWHLALPYRLVDNETLGNILFPSSKAESGVSLLRQLADIGLLEADPSNRNHFYLHAVSQTALDPIAAEHADERNALHHQLEAYFKKYGDDEAAAYHRLCGQDRTLLQAAGMTPELYWERVSTHINIRERDRRRWRLDPLPSARTLKNRIKRLREQEHLLAELCGDAAGFLERKLRQKTLEIAQLEDTKTLETLLAEADHLSDLHYLKARTLLESAPKEALAIFTRITDHLNAAHAWAWYRQGELLLQSDRRIEAGRAFKRALDFGLFGLHKHYAEGQLAWMACRHARAEDRLRRVLDQDPDWRGLREALAALLIDRDKPGEARSLLAPAGEGTLRSQFLHVEACFRLQDYAAVMALAETLETANGTPESWEDLRIKARIKAAQQAFSSATSADNTTERTPPPDPESTLADTSKHNTTEPKETDRDESPFQASLGDKLDKPDDPKAWLNLGVTLGNQGRYPEAEAACRKALKLKPDFSETWINLGVALEKQGRYPEAEAAYRKALELKPDFPEAWYNLGVTLTAQGRYLEAEAACRKALKLKPDYAEAWDNLGIALHQQGRYPEAEAAYRKALKLKPDYPQAWDNLGVTLAAQGRYPEAEAAYRKALKLKPDYPGAWNNLGVTLAAQGRYPEAEVAYRKALELKPDDSRVWGNLGVTLASQGRYPEAEAAFRKALELKPDDPKAWYSLGVTYQRMGMQARADYHLRIETAIKAVALNQASAPQLLLVAKEVWGNHGKWEEAKQCIDKSLEVQPDHPAAMSYGAWIALETDHLEEAEDLIKKVQEQEPDHPDILYPLARLLKAQGRLQAARLTLREYYGTRRDWEYRDNMEFVERFLELDDPEYAEQACLGAGALEPLAWEPRLRQAEIAWKGAGEALRATEMLQELIAKAEGRHPAVFLTDAELALAGGDFLRCRKRLDQIKAHPHAKTLLPQEKSRLEYLDERCL